VLPVLAFNQSITFITTLWNMLQVSQNDDGVLDCVVVMYLPCNPWIIPALHGSMAEDCNGDIHP
jgi:hypothetical protein